MFQVEVRSRIVGTTAPAQETPSTVILDLLNETLTVRELIAHTVEEQIRDLLIHRKLDAEQAQKILNRQYLLEEDIRQQAKSGMIRAPSAKNAAVPKIDTEAEIKKAERAFEQTTYLIVVDGYQPAELEEEITLRPTSKVTFLRMTPLVGG